MKAKLKKKYLVTMFFMAIILFLMPNMSKATNTTDFSNAEYTWADDDTSDVGYDLYGYELIISNVSVIDGHKYYYTITSDIEEPIYSSDNIIGTLSESSKVDGALRTKGLGDYVELNQDLYLWIWEYSSNDNIEYELIVSGKKLEEPYIPTDYKAFSSLTSMSYNQTCISLNYGAIGSLCGSDRIISIKIGKVSDNDILNDIYNEETDAFSNLLSYAKTSQSIYSGNLEANYYYGYSSFTELFDGANLLEDDEYYYVYVMLDDEDGKYRTVESVTIAKSNIWLEDNWMFKFLYDGADFDWSNLEADSNESDNNSNSNNSNVNAIISATNENNTNNNSNSSSSGKNDDTTSSSSLPYTGIRLIIVVIVIITLSIVVFTYKKMKYYKDIE